MVHIPEKRCAKTQVRNGGRERLNWLIETETKGEMGEGRWEVVHRTVETEAKRKMGETFR